MSKNLIIFITCLITSPFMVYSQNNIFSGTVADNEGNELSRLVGEVSFEKIENEIKKYE